MHDMKTVLITGANRGIGLEFCRQYAADGWRVLACSRMPEKSGALNRLAAQYSGLVTLNALDLADVPIDLLINNAGIYPDLDKEGFGHTDYADWAQAFRVNKMAPLKMAETFVRQISGGKQKSIVTITSKMAGIADNRGAAVTCIAPARWR